MLKQPKNNELFNHLVNWVSKDYIVIIICLLVLVSCIITIRSVDKYQKKINDIWIEQWTDSGCRVEPVPVNVTYNIGGIYNGIT